MATSGTSTCSMNYKKGTSTPTGQYQEILNTSSGIYWEPVFETNPVKACQFGTVADATFNFSNNAVTGTDNTAAIQNALDFAIRNNWKSVCINDGLYKTTDTLAVGWGIQSNTATAVSLSLLSCNQARASYSTFDGVTIIPTQTDRCAINVSGGRQTRINGIHLLGQNYAWTNSRYFNANLPVANTAAGWLDPAITPSAGNPGGLTQYAPYAGFCVDAYNGGSSFVGGISGTTLTVSSFTNGPNPIPVGSSIKGPGVSPNTTVVSGTGPYVITPSQTVSPGTLLSAAPAVPYPNQTFPAWLSNVTQYNQAGSTDTKFENTVVEGFAVGWAIGTGPGQQNGDFNNIDKSVCLNTTYCVSFGSGQSRNGSIRDLNCSSVYTVLTNLQFGIKNGELGGNFTNIGCGQTYQFFDISLGIASMSVQDLYIEGGVKIGNISGGSISFKNCLLDFLDTLTGDVPSAIISAGTGGLSIRFDDCKIAGNSRIMTLVHYAAGSGTVTFNGGALNGGVNIGALMNTIGSQNALNYTGGYFAGATIYPNINSGFTSQLVWQGQSYAANMFTPSSATGLTLNGWNQLPVISGVNRQMVTQAMQGFYDASNDFRYWTFQSGPNKVESSTLWSVVPTLTTCDTWSGVWSVSQQLTQDGQLSLGDIFYHQATGTIWVVESIGVPNPTNYPIILRQHNNMTVNASQSGGTGACTVNNLGTVGATLPGGNTTLIHVGQAQAATGATIQAGGTGYTNGAQVLTLANGVAGSPGVCNVLPTFNVTVTGNVVTAVNSVNNSGNCFMQLTNPVATTGGGGINATLNVTYTSGVIGVSGTMYYCDFAAGNTNLTNCSRGDGIASSMASTLIPGDKMWATQDNDLAQQWPFSLNARITSVTNGSPGSITLSNGAALSGRFPVVPFVTSTPGFQTNAIAAKPAVAAAGGTCAVNTTPTAGNQTVGRIALTGACAAGNTVTLTFAIIAANGWQCGQLRDQTAPTILFPQTGGAINTAIFTAQGTSGAADVLTYNCSPY